MKAAAYHRYLFNRLDQMRARQDWPAGEEQRALRGLLVRLCELASQDERLPFSTFHARLAYVAHSYQFPPGLLYRLKGGGTSPDRDFPYQSTYVALARATLACFGQQAPPHWQALIEQEPEWADPLPEREAYFSSRRMIWVSTSPDRQSIHLRDEQQPENGYELDINRSAHNELVESGLKLMLSVGQPPLLVNLLDVEVKDGGRLCPRQIILLPDYLIDVTAVAACFGNQPPHPWAALSRKLLPYEQRPALLIGNIVNHFLDLQLSNPDIEFNQLKRLIFHIQPLALCCLSDKEVKEMVQMLRLHYQVLKRVIHQELPKLAIDRRQARLEPSFYSPEYGLQGRLDLLHQGQDEAGKRSTQIIELKSGKVWQGNEYGLSPAHYIQTILYNLMIGYALDQPEGLSGYILYSQLEQTPLRFAPAHQALQDEALLLRNQLMALELLLAELRPDAQLDQKLDRLMGRLSPKRHRGLSPFVAKNFSHVLETYSRLSPLERRYLGSMLGFTAREQMMSKMGEASSERANGLASLWVDEPNDKVERFEALNQLYFKSYDIDTGTLSLHRPEGDERMSKFRQGDIVALYANTAETAARTDVLHSQVFKSTLIAIDPQSVTLRLRSRQLSDEAFRASRFWTIERDVLDSSFRNHYQGLWRWAQSPVDIRSKWLGLQPPRKPTSTVDLQLSGLTKEQNDILGRILAAPDYFLLWGPPGTGKTSIMLHHIVAHLLENSRENLLLVAYTNRAVDEICESLERIGGGFRDYLRIGSRFGTAAAYQDRLLQVRAEQMDTRAELRQLLDSHRVVVGTVASIGSKEELFRLKKFDRLIVDEASQILEPLLIGLLSRIPWALLIGDHRQLPAVVQQHEKELEIPDSELRELELHSLAGSLFERLYALARRHDWHWAYRQLRYQGRMHKRIMAYPAKAFYGGELFVLPQVVGRRHEEQTQTLRLDWNGYQPGRWQNLQQDRLLFVPSPSDHYGGDPKVNRYEAELVLEVIEAYEQLYAGHEKPIQAGDIGIIAPYRAQIAHLTQKLHQAGRRPGDFTVDTVERYQGGARRIIIISLCVNDELQLDQLAQLDHEGIDRKLNVAMTRAREHLVIIGCPELLRQAQQYAALIDFATTIQDTGAS